MRSGIRVAWPLAVSGFLPPQCDGTEWPSPGTGGSAGAETGGAATITGGTNGETGGTNGETGGTNGETGGTNGETGGFGGSGGVGASGGALPAVDEPVLGCSAGVWPEVATYEALPISPFRGGPDTITDLSANGKVVVGYATHYDANYTNTSYHPIRFDGSSWKTVFTEARSRTAVVNCDGSVVAAGYDGLRAFIKRTGQPPVIVVGKGQWATVPRGISADGTRIVGNLEYRGDSWTGFGMDAVVWTDLGVARYLWPAEPRMALHITFDGGLIAGLTDHCNYPEPAASCGQPEHLFTSTGRPNETLYPGAPATVMSSDGSTFADSVLDPTSDPYDEKFLVRLFRPSEGLTTLPCPRGSCEVVGLSSRGNILLVAGPSPHASAGGPFLWTQRHGFRRLADILAVDGVRVHYIRYTVRGLSDDGRVIVGHGFAPPASGPRDYIPFRITLPRKAYE